MSELNPQEWMQQAGANGIELSLQELLWYQRYTRLLDLRPQQHIQSKLAGSYLARSKGRGMEFDEVRHYQAGDDVRTIDWRVTARTGKAHTKLFREEKERPVFILTDLSDSMHFGSTLLYKSVQASHLAALIGWHAKQAGDKLGGLVFSQQHHLELKPRSRSTGVLHYLHALQEVFAADNSRYGLQLPQALGQIRRLVRPGSLLFVLSDFHSLDEESLRHLSAIRQHNEVVCCPLFDPLELQLPSLASGSATVTDGEQLGWLDLSNQQLKRRYQQQQQSFQQGMQQSLKQLGCRCMSISSAEPLITQLLRSWHDQHSS
ncbi:DUF58 domain-containing protein [Alkalimonas collagenimarina]|uniref:DUF58 domain-containing protein n=1 Tax=Alkalimonas collagenimarina TaxID=400390 RepID=A0ABT9GZM3_9GAMM|nr:DUF58 domain-containing protein [Alkalimonas collagenimarina]MDP4536408.1 DUF58 domain-containing protein [Alkalimonas collagenimarina]